MQSLLPKKPYRIENVIILSDNDIIPARDVPFKVFFGDCPAAGGLIYLLQGNDMGTFDVYPVYKVRKLSWIILFNETVGIECKKSDRSAPPL